MLKPILFNTEMVRAILDGRKTVTRRIIKWSDVNFALNSAGRKDYPDVLDEVFIENLCDCRYAVGDILYVRETWGYTADLPGISEEATVYAADFSDRELAHLKDKHFRWRPSIHMPKELARLYLRVTKVWAERIQNISADGCAMNTANLIARFENELGKVNRPGMDKLLAYIRQSDFYTAPASTKYHLSCEGGLLQHSLNVLDTLRGLLVENTEDGTYEYKVAGRVIEKIPADSVIIMALLHDICKTHFYTTSLRNVKNEQTGRWEKVPYYTVKDKMPLGHGDKSVMIIKQYISMTVKEMYAIWWHMGFADASDTRTLGSALDTYPIIWHCTLRIRWPVMQWRKNPAIRLLLWILNPPGAGAWADQDTEPRFEEAQAYGTE